MFGFGRSIEDKRREENARELLRLWDKIGHRTRMTLAIDEPDFYFGVAHLVRYQEVLNIRERERTLARRRKS